MGTTRNPMKGGPPAESCSARPRKTKGGPTMLYAGLDLSRKRLDFHLLDREGATLELGAVPPDADGLHGLRRRLARHGEPIRAALESMNGARFVHDQLERGGWQVEIADAQKVRGLAPLACKTDKVDARVLAELCRRELVPALWLPPLEERAMRERLKRRLHLVRLRTSAKNRVFGLLTQWARGSSSSAFAAATRWSCWPIAGCRRLASVGGGGARRDRPARRAHCSTRARAGTACPSRPAGLPARHDPGHRLAARADDRDRD